MNWSIASNGWKEEDVLLPANSAKEREREKNDNIK